MKLSAELITYLKRYYLSKRGENTISGHLIPSDNEQVDLGRSSKKFGTIYAKNVVADNVGVGGFVGNADTVDGYHASSTPTANTLLALDSQAEYPDSVYPNALLTDGSRALTGNLSVDSLITIDGVDISVHAADATIHHLAGMSQDDHSIYVHISNARTITAQHSFAPTSAQAPFSLGSNAQHQLVVGLRADELNKDVIAGDGLTDGGTLTSDVTLNVGAGTLIDVSVDAVGIEPGTAQWQVVTAGASPYTAYWSQAIADARSIEGILKTDVAYRLTVGKLGIGIYPPTAFIHASGSGEQLRLEYNTSNYFRAQVGSDGGTVLATGTGGSGGTLTVQPAGDVILDPDGLDVLPYRGYEINLGSLQKKYLTLHAAELWVETLVAQNTIATIGGRILVGPTTQLAKQLIGANPIQNYSFETAGGGGSDVFDWWLENVGDGAILQLTLYAHEGTYACYMQSGPSINTSIYSEIMTFDILYKRYFRLKFWAITSHTSYPVQYALYDVTNSSYIVNWTNANVTAVYTWDQTSVLIEILTSNTEQIQLRFRAPQFTGVDSYIDEVVMYEERMFVKHNEMTTGDTVYMEANGKVEFFSIDTTPVTYGDIYYYGITHDLDGSGGNDWDAGDAVFNTGATGDGFIDLYSVSGVDRPTAYGPTIVGNVRNSSTYNDWSEYWAIGNLENLYLFGAGKEYGVALGRYDDGNSFITIDSTNGIRIWSRASSTNTQHARWYADGNILIGEEASNRSNVKITTAGEVHLRNYTTDVITLLSTPNSAGQIANFEGVIGIGSSGGIWQGSLGTFSSPNTGFKLYQTTGGRGIWESWSGGNKQVYLRSPDMALVAGAGAVEIDANGITLDGGIDTDPNKIKWYSSDASAYIAYTNVYHLDSYNIWKFNAKATANSEPGLIAIRAESNYGLTGEAGIEISGKGNDITHTTEGYVYINLFDTDQDFAIRYFSGTYVKKFIVDATGTVTTAGAIRAWTGSASNPSFSFGGDVNTGIYAPSDGIVGISCNGTVLHKFSPYGPSSWISWINYDTSINPSNISASTGTPFAATVPSGSGYGWYVKQWYQAFYIAGTNDGSNYWEIFLRKVNGTTTTNMKIFVTSNLGSNIWVSVQKDVNWQMISTDDVFTIYFVKHGSPGNLSLVAPQVHMY